MTAVARDDDGPLDALERNQVVVVRVKIRIECRVCLIPF